jgi:hypothetical protein
MKDHAEIEALANRIDHEELWRHSPFDRVSMTPEQQDRLDAGVYLRRYAHDRFCVVEELKKGAEYIRGYKLTREGMGTDRRGCGTGAWHGAINRYADSPAFPRPADGRSKDWPRMMYTAKMVSDEVPRMILLFENERRGLATHFKMCGHEAGPGTPLPDNHLRCHLGKECRKCPYLLAIEAAPDMTVEAKDEAKAWTCATHILLESKTDTFFDGGMLHDKSYAAFNDRMARSFMDEPPEPPMNPPDGY